MSDRLRLLKVVVQPVFVVDDGTELREIPTQPVTVSATDWPTFPTAGFAEATEALRTEVERGHA